jgi:anhydro-N-acetylmuramic acid kinase
VERLQALSKARIDVPDARTVDFKEALIFAFLGLLRWRGDVNTLRSVTGARIDSIGGALYLPN